MKCPKCSATVPCGMMDCTFGQIIRDMTSPMPEKANNLEFNWNEEQRVALMGSLYKWYEIIEGEGLSSCTLCTMSYTIADKKYGEGWRIGELDPGCDACPIKIVDEKFFNCRNTPYTKWEDWDNRDKDHAIDEFNFLKDIYFKGATVEDLPEFTFRDGLTTLEVFNKIWEQD